MERIFVDLKRKRVWQRDYANHAEAIRDIADHIVSFYNSVRLQPKTGQRLNFSSLPVYGPITYNGRPLSISLYVIQLDVGDKQVIGLLTQLAGLGRALFAPASPVIGVLETIGAGLLKENKNDVGFKYHTVLYPAKSQHPDLAANTFEYADYVFLRSENRAAGHPWLNWRFNRDNGLLYTDKECNSAEKDNTYLVMQVNRASSTISLDAQNDLNHLSQKLHSEAQSGNQALDNSFTAAKQIIFSGRRYRQTIDLINQVESVGLTNLTKGLKSQLGVVVADLDRSITVLDKSSNGTATTAKLPTDILTSLQVDVIIDRLRRISAQNSDSISRVAFDKAQVLAALGLQ